ncbi:non-ribosomal peptide synthetase, partial [Bacillus pseudomycoides]|uniref:non-ribosomal peptide synthetase n=2 Tax=Bacillus pseudomycoides TaxID=64104 RepID=UPI00211D31C8
MVELFEEQVQEKPDGVVLVFKNQRMTYRTLNERANQLARTLRGQGVISGKVVGIMAHRSFEMVIGVLAVLKAGAAYLPIDPNYPVVRKQYMLEDSGANFLLMQKELDEEMAFKGTVLDLEDETLYGKETTDESISIGNYSNPEDIASIIYTSGSTGQPKGNMTTHYNISRVVKNTNYIRITEQDRLLQMASFSFDASFFEIFGSLLNGAQLVLVEKEDVLDVQRLFHVIETEGITISFFTTALFNMLVDMDLNVMKGLRKILFGGEKVSVFHVQKALRAVGSDRLIHVYGPTESTVFTTFYPINELKEGAVTVPIGVPISNTKVYVLDHKQRLCPIGVPGELYVGGDGLAKGYFNKPELTMQRFIDNPFIPGERVYRTGDIVRWLPDGNIDYIGRIDKQIKIRGHRIEPGEIMSHLLNHEAIQEAAVVPLQDSQGDTYLCAYYVQVEGIEEKEYTESSLRSYLSTRLPDYMMPSAFCQLEKFPLTVNGKIDNQMLPVPDKTNFDVMYRAPEGELEEKLVGIWKEILGVSHIGTLDNFFSSGGHSLKAMQLIGRIQKEFQIDCTLRDVFQKPTIRELATFIRGNRYQTYIKIEKAEEAPYYPATFAQQRLYVVNQLESINTAYNMPLMLKVDSGVDYERLSKGFQILIERHEAFRTTFGMEGNELVQYVHPSVSYEIKQRTVKYEDVERIQKEFVRPFDLSKGPLLRTEVLNLLDGTSIIMIDMHHIISDGVSMDVFLKELILLYGNEEHVLPLNQIQYKDYAVWQKQQVNIGKIAEHEEYWLDVFSGELPNLELPTDNVRPPVQQFVGSYISTEIPTNLVSQIKKNNRMYGSTLFMTLMAAYNVLLWKYTGQTDLIVGTTDAGRPQVETDTVIGMFVNTLALRTKLSPNQTFEELVANVKENVLQANAHRAYPFEKLVDKVAVQRDVSRNPLFDTMFTLRNRTDDKSANKQANFHIMDTQRNIAKFDLTLGITEGENGLTLDWEYSTSLFTEATIQRMASHYVQVLIQMIEDPKRKLSAFDLLTPVERQQLLSDYNNTAVSYCDNVTIHQLFEEQVRKTPKAVALVHGDEQVTFEDLNQRANKLARVLRKKGVEPEVIVGIMIRSSIDMVVSILAVLKAGGAYLPIDLDYPLERKIYMLEDSGATHLLTQFDWKEEAFSGEVLNVMDSTLYQEEGDNLIPLQGPEHAAYVIYTSGSTGKPKGVVIEHKGLINYIDWAKKKYVCGADDTFALYSSLSFDLTVTSLFTPLLSGLCTYVYEDDHSEFILYRILRENKVTILKLTPAHLSLLQEGDYKNTRVRKLIVGGEELKRKLAECILERFPKGVDIINEYGPTEATVGCMNYHFNENQQYGSSVPIGTPIQNTQLYVLDEQYNPVLTGCVGEIYIAGDGLARGYLGREELTKERFICNPFREERRMYKTGDLARMRADGQLEYIGRVDRQVKIHGYRIELGEIEEQLQRHEAVKEVVVIDRVDEEKQAHLCAYMVTTQQWNQTDIRKYLMESLPSYMVPTIYMDVPFIPLTLNGKVDYKQLPEPERVHRMGSNVQKPRNEIEEKLLNVWIEVLGVEQIGIQDNFFELGGDSIKAIKIASRLQQEGYKLEIQQLMRYGTIEEVSLYVESTSIEIDQEAVEGEVPLTPIQQWFFENELTDRHHYNQAMMLYRSEGFDQILLKQVLNKIIEHHDAFRMVYRLEETKVSQINQGLETVKAHLEVRDLRGKPKVAEEIESQANAIQRSFNLATGPLIATVLFQTDDGDHLLLVAHHLVIDGVSWRILLEDLATGYQQRLRGEEIQFPPKTHSYQEWANKLVDYA